MDEIRNAYNMLTVNLKEGEHLIWEHDVKMDLREVRCDVVVWIHLAQDVLWLMQLYHIHIRYPWI